MGLLITTHAPRSHTLIPVMLRYRLHCQEDSVLVPIPLPALPSAHPSFASVSTRVLSTLPNGTPVTLCLCLEEARPWPDSTICLTHRPHDLLSTTGYEGRAQPSPADTCTFHTVVFPYLTELYFRKVRLQNIFLIHLITRMNHVINTK